MLGGPSGAGKTYSALRLATGLANKCGSGTERLHDCRARNVIEAIMWHGCTSEGGKSDAYESVLKFRKLSKEERDQVVLFIESI